MVSRRKAAEASILAGLFLCAGLAHMTPAQAQTIDLSGQTVMLVHNAAPGGGTALAAQITADAWAKTMAGNPTMVVQSVEGGALARGIHHVMNARPDGRTLGWLAWSGSTRILDPEELQIPFEDFGLIGGVGGFNFFMNVKSSLAGGLESPDDFMKVENFTFGGFNAKSAASMRAAGALDMLGIDFNFVSGFGGIGPLQAAIQRDEVDGFAATNVDYKLILKDGLIAEGQSMGLFYFSSPNEDGTGLATDPTLADFEPFDSYYRRVKGEEPSGPVWEMIKFHGRVSDPVNWLVVAPPGTPEEHLTMLRESFAEVVSSPEFLENAERVLGQVPTLTTYPRISEIVTEVANTDEEMKDLMRGYLERMEQ